MPSFKHYNRLWDQVTESSQRPWAVASEGATMGVIPCQINKQNAFAFQISTKLGRLVPSMKLFHHICFGRGKVYGFGVISNSIFQHFGHPTLHFCLYLYFKMVLEEILHIILFATKFSFIWHITRVRKVTKVKGQCPLTLLLTSAKNGFVNFF